MSAFQIGRTDRMRPARGRERAPCDSQSRNQREIVLLSFAHRPASQSCDEISVPLAISLARSCRASSFENVRLGTAIPSSIARADTSAASSDQNSRSLQSCGCICASSQIHTSASKRHPLSFMVVSQRAGAGSGSTPAISQAGTPVLRHRRPDVHATPPVSTTSARNMRPRMRCALRSRP